MPDQYITVRRQGLYELTDRGSRFIGICRPVEEEAEAQELIRDSRLLYPEARHYVYAWRIDSPVRLQRFSDDGEPQGTGGRQLLDVLDRRSIDRAALVVVRYFGGVLLGTGGLSRAYAGAARGALEAAEPIRYLACETFLLETDYAVFHQLGGRLQAEGFFQETPDYGATVKQLVGATADKVEALQALVMDMSAGEARLQPRGQRWLEAPL